MTDAEIKGNFLENRFTVEPGETDLKPYVYQVTRALPSKGALETQGTNLPCAKVALLEAAFHKEIKSLVGKRQQGYLMGALRKALENLEAK